MMESKENNNGEMMTYIDRLMDRIIDKIEVDDSSGCWNWTGRKNDKGYGRIWNNGKMDYSHRAVFKLYNGEIDTELEINHRCNNTRCCNPSHLEAVTSSENRRWCVVNGRSNSPSWEQNHESKLSIRDVYQIRVEYASGRTSYAKLGEKFHVDKSTVYLIVKNKTWRI
jgi:hypothetical protein